MLMINASYIALRPEFWRGEHEVWRQFSRTDETNREDATAWSAYKYILLALDLKLKKSQHDHLHVQHDVNIYFVTQGRCRLWKSCIPGFYGPDRSFLRRLHQGPSPHPAVIPALHWRRSPDLPFPEFESNSWFELVSQWWEQDLSLSLGHRLV